MPHVTKHTPKVSTRSVKPYACESSREKRQQDRRPDRQTARQTDRHTHTQTDCPKPLFSPFWGLYIPNPVLSRSRFFARCQYFHWHGSKKHMTNLIDTLQTLNEFLFMKKNRNGYTVRHVHPIISFQWLYECPRWFHVVNSPAIHSSEFNGWYPFPWKKWYIVRIAMSGWLVSRSDLNSSLFPGFSTSKSRHLFEDKKDVYQHFFATYIIKYTFIYPEISWSAILVIIC